VRTVSNIPPDKAAELLDRELRQYPWYTSIGVGSTEEGTALFLYVTSAKHRELSRVADGWMGYRVIVRPIGRVRPVYADDDDATQEITIGL
jgi:hypothetical protein